MTNLGEASIRIELKRGIITVYHGTAKCVLERFNANNNSWDEIWKGINNAK